MVELVLMLDGTGLFLGNQYLGEWFNLLMVGDSAIKGAIES